MSSNEEYNQLVRKRNKKRNEYIQCQSRIDNCDYLLRRLRSAKGEVAEIKESFSENKKKDKNLPKEKCEWKGTTYNSFKEKMTTIIDENENYYVHSIDRILDTLNNEITRIENKRMSEYGLLGRLGASINSLANKIENFFN